MPSPDRPLRILTVTHNYPRFAGDPAGAFVARIALGVAQQGHHVQVIAPHAPGLKSEEENGGVRVRRFRYAPDALEAVAYTGRLHHTTLRSPLAAVAFPGFLAAFARAVRAGIREMRPDVIHAHWWFPAGWFVRHADLPHVITCHGSDVRLLARGSLVRLAARRVFTGATTVSTVSEFLAREVEHFLSGAARNLVVTPMPIDVERFSQASTREKVDPPRILYAGNLLPSKGVDLLIRAAAELSRRGVEYQVKVLGEGPSLDFLRALSQQLGIAEQVTWSPFVGQAEMPAEYGASTITVLPTRGQAEGLGLALVEALLAGSAIVGTPAGGIPEVVQHEVTGLLAQPDDPIDLANQLERLLSNTALRQRLTLAGKDYALRTYSPETTVGRFLTIYHAAARR